MNNKELELKKVHEKYLKWFDFYAALIARQVRNKIYIDIRDKRVIQLSVSCEHFHRLEKYERHLFKYFGRTWEKIEEFHHTSNVFYGQPLNEEDLKLLWHKFN